MAATAAEAPTTPPNAKGLSLPRRCSPSIPLILRLVAMLVCAFGDLTLDVLVRFTSPVAVDGDTPAEITLSAGGQAANVAAWASALGATARYVGKRGADDVGRLVSARLEATGVEVLGPEAGRTAVICSLVSPDGERSMGADRGNAVDIRPDELEPAWLDDCDHLFLSGYALLREPARSAAFRAAELARGNGAAVSVDLSTWSAIRDAGVTEFREALAALAPEVVFANEDEERIVGGMLPDVTWILKRGPAGVSFDGNERVAAQAERVVDTTGAGDALAAGWIVGGPDLALEAAARCVAQMGAMP
jgi:sugar/nucleoside kinase (ribokinase family)